MRETVTFRVTNVGNLAHDFTLGDEAAQDEHEEDQFLARMVVSRAARDGLAI